MDKPSSASGKKPSALFLSPEAPYPVIGGGPLRSASLLEYLAQCHAVHVVTFHEPGAPDPRAALPPNRVDRMDVIELPYHSRRPAARAARNALRYVRRRPPLLERFSGFERELQSMLGDEKYNVAVIEHFWCAPYLEQIRPRARRVFLDLHNIESAWHASLARSEQGLRAKALDAFAAASLRQERTLFPRFDAILATSRADAALASKIAPQSKLLVYPNALPETLAPARAERLEIAFSGNLEYQPNIQAVRFFYEQVWPSLRARWPELRWRIIGKNPHGVRALVCNDPRIELTGFVDDAVACLAQAQVAVVPLLGGSGTRIKILEAWAAGTPVVSTTIGAEGLECRPGEHLLIGDAPDEFAACVARLLESAAERGRIGGAGRRLFDQCYTWPAAWKQLAPLFGNRGPQ